MGIVVLGQAEINTQAVKESLLKVVRKHFDFDITSRVEVRADVNQFKAKEDESVWLQAKGYNPNYFEVYWDGVWLCDFTEDEDPRVTDLKFLKGFSGAYESGQITINTREELSDKKPENYLDKLVEKTKKEMKERTVEEKISKAAILEIFNEKQKKRQKIIKKLEKRMS